MGNDASFRINNKRFSGECETILSAHPIDQSGEVAVLEGGYLDLLQAMGEKGASIEGGEDFAALAEEFSRDFSVDIDNLVVSR